MKSHLSISCDLKELRTIENHIKQIGKKWGLTSKDTIEINLVIDELVTNIIEHGDGTLRQNIEITLSLSDGELTINIADDGPPFNPTRCASPNTLLPLEKRKCGGLGIHFVRKFSDRCSYTRIQGKNIFTLHKILKKESS
jgi:serine/threonine-protein kinase RsbW